MATTHVDVRAKPTANVYHDVKAINTQQWLQRWQEQHVGTRQFRPPSIWNASAYAASRIPRLILMTVSSVDEALANYGALMSSWWTHNPEYTYMLLSDLDCESFLQACCPAIERTAYSILKTGAARADLFRAIWMREVGGVYVDQDSLLTRPLGQVLPMSASMVTNALTVAGGPSPGWNFNFLAFEARSPIWQTQVRRVVANILQQGRYACHRDSRGCKGFYACVQNVTGTRPFRLTVQEITRQHGCRAIDDCHDAWDEPFRSMVVLSDRELPLKHQACHAKKGSQHSCKRPNETATHYVSLPAAAQNYYLTPEGKRDGSSAPAYFNPYCSSRHGSDAAHSSNMSEINAQYLDPSIPLT